MSLVLDSGVLSRLCHPNAVQSGPVLARIQQMQVGQPGIAVYIPEIADYEVRRKLIHLGKARSIRHLDALTGMFNYLTLDTPTMKRAADLWAQARRRGQPTADELSLDADVVLAAQAIGVGATVATTNAKHLRQFVPVQDWS